MATPSVNDMPDEELLRRAVKAARARLRGLRTRREAVMDCFLLGSTYAAQLCERFGLDPYELVK